VGYCLVICSKGLRKENIAKFSEDCGGVAKIWLGTSPTHEKYVWSQFEPVVSEQEYCRSVEI